MRHVCSTRYTKDARVIATALRFSKAPPPRNVTVLQLPRLGSRTGDTPGVQLQGEEAEFWGLKRPRRGPAARCRAGTLLAVPLLRNLTPVRRGPLSTVGGAESKERERGRRGGQLLRAPPSSLLGSSSPPLLPQPCSTRGEGLGKGRGTGDQGGERLLCLREGGDESWGEQREEAVAASEEPALGPAVELPGATIMVKRKSSEGQEQDSGRGIPLPIQTFLWRQTR